MRTCIIFNPTARGDKARRFQQRLHLFHSECSVKLSGTAGAARRLAGEAVQEGFEIVVAAGGDGTVNEVVNGIGDVPDGFSRARLGILPLGTVNVFAREIGISPNFEMAWQTICAGHEADIDLPYVQQGVDHSAPPRYFIQMAGSGWDARAVELVSWQLKKRIGQFAYMVAGLRALRGTPASISIINGSNRYQGELVVIGNGRYYGGTFSMFHQADFRDGVLDVCVFPKVNWFVLVRYAWAYLSQTPARLNRETYFQAPSIQLEGCDRCPIQVDGEPAGLLPAVVALRPRTLRLIVPLAAI